MKTFLKAAGWADATHSPIAGDASARQYSRLSRNGQSAVLMQDPEGDVALFARLARHLSGIGLSAPRILAEDAQQGLLLLEDLGDGLIARLAETEAETPLYLCAVDALVELHRHPPAPDLPLATPRRLAEMVDLAFDWYAQTADGKQETIAAFEAVLERHALPADVMVLRDYHAENILVLPDRSGAARAGLLDFQDALVGHRAYDLVSLIEDARREVPTAVAEAAIAHYLQATGIDETGFRTSLAVLGAQRNLRILGVFARLAATGGKPHYLDLIPRVWGHLQNDLRHAALGDIRAILQDRLPAPTHDHLERLKSACPTP